MSKWICENPDCKKPCYAEPPEHCAPIECLLSRNNTPYWRKIYEPTANDGQLPKLTVEVFDREDCPEWAKYAAQAPDGTIAYYRDYPLHDDMPAFSYSIIKDSLIERPAKQLPDWCKVGKWGYNPSRGCYFEIVKISDNHIEVKYPHITNECYSLTIEYFKKCDPFQARLRPFNAEEMRGLVGKVIENENYVHFINTFDKDLNEVVAGSDGYTAPELLEFGYTIDDKPCGVLEHLEHGAWVE